ncbi:hypothetical protein PHMEG_00011689 [Phytophthora megakarya]|uniref:Uncharacterized protein n=1 Tax=Phytophthora megakarya TaxID=4795 RepID=A0A225WAY1_9STRA|nr:hypothetical protein PHMEG_00011689 [Phytophthora megakarya]
MFQDDEEGDTKEENVEKEEEDHRDDEEDDEEDEQVPDSMCPLATAIKVRRLDIAKYLYNTNGYKPSSLETVVVGAANNGPLELVKLFYDDGRYDGFLSLFAFEFAAGAGNVEIMKFFLSKGDLDVASLEGAYVMAASFGKADVIRYLYSIKGFQPSSSSIQKALVSAAEEGYVDVVKMLTVKENFSSQVIEKAFASAATNNGITFKTVRDQAGVLEYLFAKGCISPCFIRRIFSDAASRSCLDVVKFLYAKGSIPPKMVTDACCSAYTRNGGNICSVECLSKSGCLSRDLLKKVSREKAGHIRVERFYRQHLRRSYPGPTVLVGSSDNKKTVKDITYDAHQLKCIRADVFPRKIRVLHHVMKMIDLFCMPLDVAMMEAAATAEITAASGCLEATKYLLSRYGIDTFDPLKQALKHGHYNIVKEICETMDAEMLLGWAVDHCEFEVVKQIYYMYQHRSETAAWELYEIMISAIRMGNFDIVKFLNEYCDGELHDNGLKELEGFPLTRAIECGRIQIAKYLYRSKGCATLSIFESAYSSAAGLGSMELVKLFCRDKRCSTSLISRSFVVAAGGGQLAVMKYLQLHRDYDASILSDAFKQAAGCGQTEVVQQLYLDGYQPSLSTFDEAAIVAGGGGHLNIVKLLDGKERISEELAMKMFMSAAKDEGLRCDEIDDQVGVMKFLYAKGCITCNAIVEMFPEAAKSGCVDVMEFLFTTGSIPSDVMDEAFQNAADENCAEIVEFLYQTGKISSTVLEDVFMFAAQEEDMYVIECLYESGCNSQELLDRASRSTSPTSLFNLFLSHHSGK